jgi:GrpB-like predicted nucleotidyltransferase (UPF0157 family)
VSALDEPVHLAPYDPAWPSAFANERRRLADALACNVHLVEYGADLWIANIALRDYLRATPDAAAEYRGAKEAAIARGATQLVAYSEAKAPMVAALLRRAMS